MNYSMPEQRAPEAIIWQRPTQAQRLNSITAVMMMKGVSGYEDQSVATSYNNLSKIFNGMRSEQISRITSPTGSNRFASQMRSSPTSNCQ